MAGDWCNSQLCYIAVYIAVVTLQLHILLHVGKGVAQNGAVCQNPLQPVVAGATSVLLRRLENDLICCLS